MFYKRDDAGYKIPAEGVQLKTLVHGDKTLLCEFRLNKGSQVPEHSHPHEQTGYMVSGRLKLVVGPDTFVALPGDGWSIPGDVVHAAETLEDSVIVEVFSPVREDYL